MYAVVRTGGKMYRVAEKDRLVVERLQGEPGTTVALKEVLMVAGDGEAPRLAADVGGATVFAEILAQKRGKKIIVFKKKRRKNYRRTRGHRQELTELRIAGISLSGEPAAAEGEEAAAAPAPDTGQHDIAMPAEAVPDEAADDFAVDDATRPAGAPKE
jgi:large subunit ribosomal protein L21